MVWSLSPAASAASLALRRPYPYEGGGPWSAEFCVDHATAPAVRLAQLIRRAFPIVREIGTTAGRCQPLHTTRRDASGRRVPGPDLMSVHAIGRALDVMLPIEAGNDLADWLVTNADALGVQLVIRDHSVWQGSLNEPRLRPYHGSSPHTDHVHVEVKLAPGSATAEPAPVANAADPEWLWFRSATTPQPPRVPGASSPDVIPADVPSTTTTTTTTTASTGGGGGWLALLLLVAAFLAKGQRR